MEHSIKDTKELMNGQGANLSFSTAQLYSRESDDVKCIMKNFDQENNVRKESTKHQRKQHTDIQIVVDILEEMKAFTEIPGRTHTGIGSVPKDPISVLNYRKTKTVMASESDSYHSRSEFYYPDEENVPSENKNYGNARNDNEDEMLTIQEYIEKQRQEITTKKTAYDINV
ncbi:hypothetical protein ACROYT_G015581 [Oculina patagonica]